MELLDAFKKLNKIDPDKLIQLRRDKFSKMGNFQD
jgi:acetyl-CoA carboxylase alpha subunit